MPRLLVCLLVVVVSTLAWADSGPDAIVGTWLTNDGTAKVQITNEQGVYNGRVVWLQAPVFPAGAPDGLAGKPKTDRNNPDASLRSRPVMGMTMLSGLHYGGGGVWEGGTLYAPASGKSYPCKVSLGADGALEVAVGGGIFGKTVAWTRASQ